QFNCVQRQADSSSYAICQIKTATERTHKIGETSLAGMQVGARTGGEKFLVRRVTVVSVRWMRSGGRSCSGSCWYETVSWRGGCRIFEGESRRRCLHWAPCRVAHSIWGGDRIVHLRFV